MSTHDPHRDADPALGALIESAYSERVDLDVAARHLWVLHRAAGTVRATRPGARKALVSVLAGGMLFMSSGGAVAASAGSLPGDVLYSVKRGVETARIVLTVSSEGDARLYLALAERRMAELRTAAAKRPEAVPVLVRDAKDSLESAERRGGATVAHEVEEASQELDVLVAVLDESAADSVENRKTTPAETETAMMPSASPTATSSDTASPEAAATESEDAALASAQPSPTPTDSSSESATASPSPSAGASETTTGSPSPSSSPTSTASPSTTPTPTSTATPTPTPSSSETTSPSPSPSESSSSEPTPSSSPTRKYESVDPTETPSGTEPVDPAPTPGETPTA